jgi:hypothetical protein
LDRLGVLPHLPDRHKMPPVDHTDHTREHIRNSTAAGISSSQDMHIIMR